MCGCVPETLVILPGREVFSPAAAGAISLVVRRFALALPGTVVVGLPRAATFDDVPYRAVRGWWGLLRLVAAARPEVVEVHQQPRLAVALALLFRRVRVVLVLHNDPKPMRGLRWGWERRLALGALHRIVFVSRYLRDRFTGDAPGKLAVLPNPLTLAELPPAGARENLILFAGRMTTDKAPDMFVAACAAALPGLPGWRAAMIGGDRFGPDSPETGFVAQIRAAAASAGIGFAGPRPHAEVLAAMAHAAIVVVPSRWAEPFGLTALEAMASGAALIAAETGGLPEVAGDAALYVPPGDAAALAAAITALATDQARRTALAAAGQARAALFDTQILAPRLARLRGPGICLDEGIEGANHG
jgi:glycosyltransferase involved in cell wall biosynthesis